ncbi:WD40 repeat-like protein [Hanseniaspora valbyensis NRRL Y-1626]|uniref:WD40 repeat-like protein n=1 Tax=Hanseniaspora valbyensis NRRL Y-1626 TaxID=766949 RepID=A0A1B7T9M9_9ASCO|nr:WD40 repeat-like protein [Hanseniaspora valbyensis NRRL Y-1626]
MKFNNNQSKSSRITYDTRINTNNTHNKISKLNNNSKKNNKSYVNDKLLEYYIKENLINNSTIVSQTNGDKIYPLLDLDTESISNTNASIITKIVNKEISNINTTTNNNNNNNNNVILSPDNSDNESSSNSNSNNTNSVNNNSNNNSNSMLADNNNIEKLLDSNLLKQHDELALWQLLKSLNKTEISDLINTIKPALKTDFTQVLPQNVITEIFTNLPITDLKECMLVNKSFENLIKQDDNLWTFVMKRENYFKNTKIKDKQDENEFLLQSNYSKFKNVELKFYNWRRSDKVPFTRIVNAHDVDVITCLELTPFHVITAADDTFIKIYDQQGSFLKTLKGHDGGVWALKYNTESNQLITAGTDRTIRIWDLNKFVCTHVFMGHTSTVRCLDLTDTEEYGRVIVSGSRDSNVLVWKLPSNDKLTDSIDGNIEDNNEPITLPMLDRNKYYVGTLKGHTDSVRSMSVHKDILVTGSYDGTCRIWDLKQMKCITVLKGHGNRVYAVCFDHVRQKIFSTSTDFRIFVWDLRIDRNYSYKDFDNNRQLTYNRPAMILNGHAGLVGLLELKGDILCSAAADGSVKGWDVNDYKVLFQYYHDGTVPTSSFWFDENFLILGSESQFTICDLRTGKQLHHELLKDADNIWGIKANGDRVYAAIVQDHCSKLAVLDFSNKVEREGYINYDSNVNGGLCVDEDYMMERRGKTFLRLLEDWEADHRPNILNHIISLDTNILMDHPTSDEEYANWDRDADGHSSISDDDDEEEEEDEDDVEEVGNYEISTYGMR